MMPKIVKRIYFLNNFTNSEEKYLIEYMDGSLKKAGTEEACKMHPLELIRFLEASLTMSDVAGRAQERS